eukprot:Sspe_Gene.52347::Locus_29014_Transcript_1_4_Confidence_0.333_Length_2044::g.52347::m.52347
MTEGGPSLDQLRTPAKRANGFMARFRKKGKGLEPLQEGSPEAAHDACDEPDEALMLEASPTSGASPAASPAKEEKRGLIDKLRDRLDDRGKGKGLGRTMAVAAIAVSVVTEVQYFTQVAARVDVAAVIAMVLTVSAEQCYLHDIQCASIAASVALATAIVHNRRQCLNALVAASLSIASYSAAVTTPEKRRGIMGLFRRSSSGNAAVASKTTKYKYVPASEACSGLAVSVKATPVQGSAEMRTLRPSDIIAVQQEYKGWLRLEPDGWVVKKSEQGEFIMVGSIPPAAPPTSPPPAATNGGSKPSPSVATPPSDPPASSTPSSIPPTCNGSIDSLGTMSVVSDTTAPPPVDPELRARCEEFYSYYCPSKLQQLDSIIGRRAGNPDALAQMWQKMLERYGPWPPVAEREVESEVDDIKSKDSEAGSERHFEGSSRDNRVTAKPPVAKGQKGFLKNLISNIKKPSQAPSQPQQSPPASQHGPPIRANSRLSEDGQEGDPATSSRPTTPDPSITSISPSMGYSQHQEVTLTKEQTEGLGVKLDESLLLVSVYDGSAAQRCGLQRYVGCRLVMVNDKAVTTFNDVREFVGQTTLHLRFEERQCTSASDSLLSGRPPPNIGLLSRSTSADSLALSAEHTLPQVDSILTSSPSTTPSAGAQHFEDL